MTARKIVSIYIDGSCIPQHDIVRRRAGIGVSLGLNHKLNVSEALVGDKQTSARAEIAAAVRALQIWSQHFPLHELHLYSDNAYALLEVNRVLRPKEHKKLAADAANLDLIKRLQALLNVRKAEVRTHKVKAHSGDVLNDDADRLAKAAAYKALHNQNKADNAAKAKAAEALNK